MSSSLLSVATAELPLPPQPNGTQHSASTHATRSVDTFTRWGCGSITKPVMLPTPHIMCSPASFAKLLTLALAAFPLACAPSASPGKGDANTSDPQVGCPPADGDVYI